MAEKKRVSKSASKPTTPRGQLRGAVGAKKNWQQLRIALEAIKHDAAPIEFAKLLGLAEQSPLLPVAIAAANSLRKRAPVQSVDPLATATLSRELIWVCLILARGAKPISTYARQRDNFFHFWLLGDFDTAIAELDHIDEEHGLSLWSIENRIALLSGTPGGFEAQKTFVAKIRKANQHSFLSFYAANIGERNETRVSRKGYESRLRDRANKWKKIEESKVTYIFFHLLDPHHLSNQDYADVLAYEASSSTIDLYETTIRILSNLSEEEARLNSLVREAIRALAPIDDHRARRTIALWSDADAEVDVSAEPAYRYEGFLVHYLAGRYEEAAREVATWLASCPDDPTALVTAGQLRAIGAHVDLPKNSPIENIATLYAAFFGGEQPDEIVGELEKVALNFRQTAFSSTLLLPVKSRTVADFAIGVSLATHSAVSLPATHAQVLKQLGAAYTAAWQNHAPLLLSLDPLLVPDLSFGAAVELSNEAKSYRDLAGTVSEGEFDRALLCVEDLCKSHHAFFRREGALLKSLVLLKMGEVEAALEACVEMIVHTPSYARTVPLAEIVRSRGFKELKRLQGNLTLPLAFFLFQQTYATRIKDVALKVAWRQFLAAHGVTKPSQLSAKAEFDRSQFSYFLREVCIQEVMELGRSFKSPGDLDRERIDICRFLSTYDSENFSEYAAEIVDLTRRVSIEEGVKVLESSRIYVDVIGLQRWAEKHLGELFLRYRDYEKLGLASSVDDLRRDLQEIMKKKVSQSAVQSYIESYDITADSLLEEMLSALGIAFLSLPRYGLDSFLSSRVRHGSLVINLRGCLERFNLITKVNSQTNEYEPNHHWLQSLFEPGLAENAEALDKAFRRFAHETDRILAHTVTEVVHVRSEQKAGGILGFTEKLHSRGTLIKGWVIASKVAHATASLPTFVNWAVETLYWPAMTNSLKHAQDFISHDLVSQLHHALDTLKGDAQKVAAESCGWLVSNIESARDELTQSAERVSKWFTPPRQSELDYNYTVRTGMEIGLRSYQTLDPGFQPEIVWDIADDADAKLSSGGFGLLNDLSFLIFGNVRKHAGFGPKFGKDDEAAKMKVMARLGGPRSVDILVSNGLSEQCDRGEIQRNVDHAKSEIAARRFDSAEKKTSKSGLVRLAGTLDYENFDDTSLDFGFDGRGEFFVRVTLPPASLVLLAQ